MKAVLFGSIATVKKQENIGDIDVITDVIPKNAELTLESDYANSYKVELWENHPMDVIVPKPGSSWQMILDTHPEGISKITDQEEHLLYAASLILPGKSYAAWRQHMYEYQTYEVFMPPEERYESLKYTYQNCQLYRLHRKECLSKAKKHPKLNQSKDKFFGREIYDIFEHDDLHKAVALGDVPVYTKFLKGEVEVDREAFDKLSWDEKLNCAYEECAVLSLERSLIPFIYLPNRVYNGDEATFEFALYKVCTTITSGWFRDFCIINHTDIMHKFNSLKDEDKFRKRFFKARKENAIKVNNKELVNG